MSAKGSRSGLLGQGRLALLQDVLIAIAAFVLGGPAVLHGESIVVEQGNQVVRTGDVRAQAGEQIHVRDAQSKLDIQQFLVVEGGTVQVESNGTLNSSLLGGHTRLAADGARAFVDGSGSNWTVGGFFEVGDAGEAHLTILNGGRLQTGLISGNRSRVSGAGPGATASTATIAGTGSIWVAGSTFAVGDSGEAHLVIRDGGKLESGLDGRSSRLVGGGGPGEAASSATIEGIGAMWTAGGDLAIGDSGEAHLIVRDGARVESGAIGKINKVGGGGGLSEAASTATVTGSGSTWVARGDFAIGDSGEAHLFIRDGGKVESGLAGGTTHIVGGGAEEGEAPSTVTVSGRGSAWDISGELYIGRGSLSVLDAGRVTSGGGGTTYLDGLGQVTVSGADSAWEIQGNYLMARNGPVSTRIANGGLLAVTGNIESRPGGVLQIDGGRVEAGQISSDVDIRGSGSIKADVTSQGTTIVGGSTGLLAIEGDFTQTPTGSLLMEIAGRGGVAGVDFDQLIVQDIATLSGMIDVSLADGFMPVVGDSFDLIRYGSLQFGNPGGVPAELNLPALDPQMAWHSNFGPEVFTISVQAIPEPSSLFLAGFGLLAAWRCRRAIGRAQSVSSL